MKKIDEKKRHGWLVLMYSMPAGTGSTRVRFWRRFKKMGMVAFRNSVYFLPFNEDLHENMQWLCSEIQDAGGEATLMKVDKIENVPDETVMELFREARGDDYADLVKSAREINARLGELPADARKATPAKLPEALSTALGALEDETKSLERRLGEIFAIDYFHAPGRREVETELGRCRRTIDRLRSKREVAGLAAPQKLNARDYEGKTWFTRPRPHVDRIGTAWAIRRFVDARASFVFAAEPNGGPDGSVPYDYPRSWLSHQGEDCTLETLLKTFGINDAALADVAEIVHDADLKDSKFYRPEAPMLDVVIKGLARIEADDAALLEKGMCIFDALYAGLGGKASSKSTSGPGSRNNRKSRRKRNATV